MSSLREVGLKVTQPRIMILKLLESSEQRHFSISDIFDLLVEKDQRLALGTIYRVLDQFEKSGLVISHQFSANNATYELTDADHHDHMIDSKSGQIIEFYDEMIVKRQHEIAKKYGFIIQDYRLILYGEFKKN